MALLPQNSIIFSWSLKPKSTFTALLGSSLNTKKSISPRRLSSPSSLFSIRCYSVLSQRPLRYAVLGAGYAGLSVVWHLLQHSPKEAPLFIDIYDEIGIGGGASGMSGGLLHPYSPKVKLLWKGEECWKESLNLLRIAENAKFSQSSNVEKQDHGQNENNFMVRRRGILRPALSSKNMDTMINNAQDFLASCRIETINRESAHNLVPSLFVPLDVAFHMPEAVNVHSQYYLEALYTACQNAAKDLSTSGVAHKELCLHKKSIDGLLELAGEYDAVIICLGARAAFLPELSGRLPLRTCRGVIARLRIDDHVREDYPDHGPSILADAWLAIQGPRDLHVGATWEWKSRNYSRAVSEGEATKALEELLQKASTVYPGIKKWSVRGLSAGLRAMPPLTPQGSLPLLGCVDELVGCKEAGKLWLFTGLGSRGLLYHGWLGKVIAQAVLSGIEGFIPLELTSWKHNVEL
ncbi:uncharacterized protein LOC116003849 isoform X2 [Ipomoea triloba]|uniref:uncharacterized protein LOC116003849 isoform X2 n=1 Tax=Ipomoea triloba TaxID=35885 RepID=UPI00125D048D|nr:uncharacterized protein LOC116003849 isoform X2 [Ipomoea triloba]